MTVSVSTMAGLLRFAKKVGDIFVVGSNVGFGFDGVGWHFHQFFIALVEQRSPRFRDGGAGLGATVAAAVFFAGGFERFAGFDADAGEIAGKRFGGLGRWVFEEVELVNAAIFVAALCSAGRQKLQVRPSVRTIKGTPVWKAYSRAWRTASSALPGCLTSMKMAGLEGGWQRA